MFKTVDRKHELYRIGDCIISVNGENPSKNFGGKWELLCPGRTLVCVDTSQSEFNALKKTGGSKTHTLTTAQMPSHTHSQNAHNHGASSSNTGSHRHNAYYRDIGVTSGSSKWSLVRTVNGSEPTGTAPVAHDAGEHSHTVTVNNATPTNNNTGGGQAHNNLQPFMAVYIWVRIA